MKLEPRVQEVHRSKLAEGPEAEVEEVDDVDCQHRDEIQLKAIVDFNIEGRSPRASAINRAPLHSSSYRYD